MISKNIYLFDVDGTLTPARQKMSGDFYSFFIKWMKDKKIYFVSGSDYKKIQQQVPENILLSVDGVFGCMGNTLHQNGEKIYENDFRPSQSLLNYLNSKLKNTEYPNLCGTHIEERAGMINFSVVGRGATQEQRKDYFQWDMKTGERKQIAYFINKHFNLLEASVGGEISIDIYPIGWDKSQVLKYIEKGSYHFFGDKAYEGGNDYALAKALDKEKDKVYNVEGYKETWQFLKSV